MTPAEAVEQLPSRQEDRALSVAEAIDELERVMLESGCPVVEEQLTHRFSGSIYAREIFLPSGTLVTSLVHKEPCIATCSMGAIWVLLPDRGFQLVQAPATIESGPGMRRVGLAQGDTVWTTYHDVGDERDIETIEADLYEPLDPDRKAAIEELAERQASARKRMGEILGSLHIMRGAR